MIIRLSLLREQDSSFHSMFLVIIALDSNCRLATTHFTSSIVVAKSHILHFAAFFAPRFAAASISFANRFTSPSQSYAGNSTSSGTEGLEPFVDVSPFWFLRW